MNFEVKGEVIAITERLKSRIPHVENLARRAIDEDWSLEQFRTEAFNLMPSAQPITRPQLSDVKPKDWARYSVQRAIATIAETKRADGIEKEISDELALKSGSRPEGVWIPDEALAVRSHVAGTGTLGGMLVETQNLGDQFISALRNRARVLAMGARVLNLSGPVTIPRQSGCGQTNWVGESVAATLTAMDFQHVSMTPKAVSCYQQYSKQLLLTGSPSIDQLIRDDIIQQLGLAIDLAALHGSGGTQPTGIAGTTGINTVALNADGLALGNATAYPALCSLETLIANNNADVATMGYLMRAGHRAALKQQQRFSGTDTPVWSAAQGADGLSGTVNGYRAEVSGQIATNLTQGSATTLCSAIFFGDWNSVVIGQFGATDLVCDPFTLATNAVVRIIARRWVDVALRTPSSMSILGGVLTT